MAIKQGTGGKNYDYFIIKGTHTIQTVTDIKVLIQLYQ